MLNSVRYALFKFSENNSIYHYHKNLLTTTLRQNSVRISDRIENKIEHVAQIEQALHDLKTKGNLGVQTQLNLSEEHFKQANHLIHKDLREFVYRGANEIINYLSGKSNEKRIKETYFHSTLNKLLTQAALEAAGNRGYASIENYDKMTDTPLILKISKEKIKDRINTQVTNTIENQEAFKSYEENLKKKIQRIRDLEQINDNDELNEKDLKIMLAVAIHELHKELGSRNIEKRMNANINEDIIDENLRQLELRQQTSKI
ncbi:Uncharacterised protein [uncultured archaeon]|nr:Uncharacterised protein [uncultured archaeon]